MRPASAARLAVLTLVVACSEHTASPSNQLAAPALQTPRSEVPIRQNDASTGCPFSPTHGYGFQVAFAWEPVPGAAQYHIVLHHTGSQYPVLDAVVDQPSYLLLECNAYVIEQNRFGWQWSVAGIAEDGEEGAWAEQRTYEFEAITLPPQP
jgi:hypothetical protein